MTKDNRQDGAPSLGSPRAAGESEKGVVGPTGLTYRERQRRRIVIAGLAAPTLISLPSRRAWSVQCSKSKLKKLSGNLSAKKKTTTTCDPIACGKTHWKDKDWPVSVSGVTRNDDFEMLFTAGILTQPMYKSPVTLQMVLEGKGDVRKEDVNKNKTIWDGRDGELKTLNKAIVTAFCNAHFLNNMGFIIDFVINGTSTSAVDVVMMYEGIIQQVVLEPDDTIAKDMMKDFRQLVLEPANENQHCPL